MISYRLSLDGAYAERLINGVSTGIFCNVETDQEYLAWRAAGNEPESPKQES